MVTTPFFPIPLYTIALGNYSRLLHMTQVGNTAFFATDCSFARQTPFLVLTANSWLKRYTKTQTNRAGIDCCWLHVSGYCVISGFTSNCLMNKRDCSLLLIDCIQLSSSLIPSLSLSFSLSSICSTSFKALFQVFTRAVDHLHVLRCALWSQACLLLLTCVHQDDKFEQDFYTCFHGSKSKLSALNEPSKLVPACSFLVITASPRWNILVRSCVS